MHFGLLRFEPRRLQRGRALGVRTGVNVASMASTEGEFFVSLDPARGLRGWPPSATYPPGEVRIVGDGDDSTLPLPLRHSAPSGRASPILSETGASTPFNRIIDTRKSSVHVTSRKSAGASSPSCTKTRSPRTTSIASMSFQAPSRLTQASSVTQRA